MGITGRLNIKSFCFNAFQENCYVLSDGGGSCVIVDPGCYTPSEVQSVREYISGKGLSPAAIWLTHAHFDHIFGVAGLREEYGIPVRLSPLDKITLGSNNDLTMSFGLRRPEMSFSFEELIDGQEVEFGFKVIATPGHTPGCVCFLSEEAKILFSGDTLFAGSIGRTDVEGGDYDKELSSILERLMTLPGDVDVFPGHGPATSIAEERTGNPFLRPWDGPWDVETD